jgi:hypothetical protein
VASQECDFLAGFDRRQDQGGRALPLLLSHERSISSDDLFFDAHQCRSPAAALKFHSRK